ncbi:hypothetical protein L6452_19571 [Arctium lappa]|uniref:Uncharacterized protein n=1 Tax=Arctium lappa TaxID=4217 RepID=A0ACB9BAB4_ARCLA|nr:hypothetical protein L6452_19571 [Arctium lappa]
MSLLQLTHDQVDPYHQEGRRTKHETNLLFGPSDRINLGRTSCLVLNASKTYSWQRSEFIRSISTLLTTKHKTIVQKRDYL